MNRDSQDYPVVAAQPAARLPRRLFGRTPPLAGVAAGTGPVRRWPEPARGPSRRWTQPPPLTLPEPLPLLEPLPLDPPLLGVEVDAGGAVYVGAGCTGAVYVGAGWEGAVYVGAGLTGAVYVGAVAVDVRGGTTVSGTVLCTTGIRRGGSAFSSTAVAPNVPADSTRAALCASASLAARASLTALALAAAEVACAAPVAAGKTRTVGTANTGFGAGVACAEWPLRAATATTPVAAATSTNAPAAAKSNRRARMARSGCPSRRPTAELECSVLKLDIYMSAAYRQGLPFGQVCGDGVPNGGRRSSARCVNPVVGGSESHD